MAIETSDDVGVVVVSYRSAAVMEGLLGSIPASTSTTVHGVIVDNASEEAVQKLADRAGFAYRSLDNPGYGAAINAAVELLPDSVAWVLVSNPDVELEAGSLDRMLEYGRSDEKVGAIGPRILDSDGAIYPSARAIPSLRVGVGHALLGRVWPSNPWSRKYLRGEVTRAEDPSDTGWLSGACLLVRRSAFSQLGGFDTRYFMYFEDVDFGLRMGREGYRNVYLPSARVRHIGGTSTAADSVQMIRVHHESARLFLSQKYSGPILAPLRQVLKVGLAVRAALLTRR
jgi:N-acetylglucosaminyl-diphospho-decaprenol L-rhamnosyltransferase